MAYKRILLKLFFSLSEILLENNLEQSIFLKMHRKKIAKLSNGLKLSTRGLFLFLGAENTGECI